MICPAKECTGKLKVTHTYAGKGERAQRVVCKLCHKVYTAKTIISPVTKRGTGAHTKRKRKKGTKLSSVPFVNVADELRRLVT